MTYTMLLLPLLAQCVLCSLARLYTAILQQLQPAVTTQHVSMQWCFLALEMRALRCSQATSAIGENTMLRAVSTAIKLL
jgi:hypothetical protein